MSDSFTNTNYMIADYSGKSLLSQSETAYFTAVEIEVF